MKFIDQFSLEHNLFPVFTILISTVYWNYFYCHQIFFCLNFTIKFDSLSGFPCVNFSKDYIGLWEFHLVAIISTISNCFPIKCRHQHFVKIWFFSQFLVNNFCSLYAVLAAVNLSLCWLFLSVIFIITLIKCWELGFISLLILGGKMLRIQEIAKEIVCGSQKMTKDTQAEGDRDRLRTKLQLSWDSVC